MFTTTKTVTGRFFIFFKGGGGGGKQDGNTLDKHTAKETVQAFNSLSKQQKIMLSKQIQNSHGSLSSRIYILTSRHKQQHTKGKQHKLQSPPPPPPPPHLLITSICSFICTPPMRSTGLKEGKPSATSCSM